MFCVECGSQERLYGSLCRECLLSKAIIKPPSHIALDMCHTCGRFLDGGRWQVLDHVEQSARILEAATGTHRQVDAVRWEVPGFEPSKGEHRLMCQAFAGIGGEEIAQDFEIGIRIRVQMCPSCSRQSSDYYEAVLQLRRQGVAARDAENELAKEHRQILDYADTLAGNDENAFLTKWGPVPGGIDYYIGSMVLARNIAARMRNGYGARINESNTLVGMKDGQDLYRWTILIKLPAMGSGDIVAYDKELYVVDSVPRKVLVLKSIEKGQIRRVSPDDSGLRMVARASEFVEAVVVSHDSSIIQVLEPETMKTVTVLRPPYKKHVGETVPVVRYDGRLHAV